MMKKKKLISACLSLVLICAMTACAAKPSEAPSTPQNSVKSSETQSSPQSKEAFNLKVGILYDPDVMDPTISRSAMSFSFVDYLFEGLTRYEKGKDGAAAAQEGQAESYSLSDDGLTYRFVLRDDIFWSDGKPVVAEDFVYSWQRLVDPATGSTYASLLSMVENAQEILDGEKKPSELGVTAVDEKTVEVKLAQKCSYFADICAAPPTFPVRKDIVEKEGGEGYKTSKTFVSNGAYSLETWERDDKLSLVKNTDYYSAEEIGPDRLDFSVIGDNQQAQSLFSNGQLDAVYEISKNAAINMAGTEQLVQKPVTGIRMVYLNNQEAPFTDPNVRQAFSLAIDRNALVNDQSVSSGTPLGAFVPYGIADPSTGEDFRKAKESYFKVNTEDYAANCEEAKKLLAEAGFENGEKFPNVRFLYVNTEFDSAIAETLAKDWEKVLNVKVEMVPLDRKTWSKETTSHNYHISSNSWVADYNDPTTFLDLFESTNTFNTANYNNPEYDTALKEAENAATTEERYAALHKAEDIIFADHAVVPLYNTISCHLVQNNITGVETTPTQILSLKYVQLK